MRNLGIKANDNVKTGLIGEHSEKSEVDAAVEEPSVESAEVIYFGLLNRRRVLTRPQTRQMKGIRRIE